MSDLRDLKPEWRNIPNAPNFTKITKFINKQKHSSKIICHIQQ